MEKIYNNHKKYFNKYIDDKELENFSQLWLDENTIDYWRHNRMGFDISEFLINEDINNSVLTIGDGKFGLDSIKLKKKGVKNVHPSDISDVLLKKSKDLSLIKEYHIVNAENIQFEDNSFDYIFCKESIHHCPRPFLALYEMIRVSRKGVFLIEPLEKSYSIRSFIKKSFKIKKNKIIGKFEDSSNFLYMQSLDEYIKLAISLNMPNIAYKKINDHYQYGVEFKNKKSVLFIKILFMIILKNILSLFKVDNENMLIFGFFKNKLDKKNKNYLKNINFSVFDIDPNPYL